MRENIQTEKCQFHFLQVIFPGRHSEAIPIAGGIAASIDPFGWHQHFPTERCPNSHRIRRRNPQPDMPRLGPTLPLLDPTGRLSPMPKSEEGNLAHLILPKAPIDQTVKKHELME